MASVHDVIVCDGCGAEQRTPAPGFDDLRHAVLVTAYREGWQWCRQYADRAHHFCPACVTAGKYRAFYELYSGRPVEAPPPQDVCENDTMAL
jgi:hypothetical protein